MNHNLAVTRENDIILLQQKSILKFLPFPPAPCASFSCAKKYRQGILYRSRNRPIITAVAVARCCRRRTRRVVLSPAFGTYVRYLSWRLRRALLSIVRYCRVIINCVSAGPRDPFRETGRRVKLIITRVQMSQSLILLRNNCKTRQTGQFVATSPCFVKFSLNS